MAKITNRKTVRDHSPEKSGAWENVSILDPQAIKT